MARGKIDARSAESRFLKALEDVFIGVEVEGKSGYINLMRIKSKYFDKVLGQLLDEIEERIREFPEFREELYDKLYSFFKRYFSESGSIFFRHTPFSERVYERVYTDSKDVVMFWKTHMLYYVKTDILPKSMEVELDGFKFFFDVSKLQHKKANEKRELIYQLQEVRDDGTIVFTVLYSEKGEKTKVDEILKELGKRGIRLDEETLERVLRVFERQSEVDYFINKNAREFLREQFDLWLYQYILSDESWFTEKRIKQLKVLKEIAYKIIDFIAQFEDEVLKIWKKPKFVLNSNYVITLDRIANKNGGIDVIKKIVERLKEHEEEFRREIGKWREIKEKYGTYRERMEAAGTIKNQIVEWYLLDIIDEDFNPEDILTKGGILKYVSSSDTPSGKESLNPKYRFLPIDTKYFKDLEPEMLKLFDNLDQELDGWLIKSENWQALNTILPKFKEKVQAIYIDPPFNTGSNEFTMYVNKFLDSAWITMMENRLTFAREFLKETGSIFVRIDYHGNHYVRFLMDEIFGKENFRNEIIVKRGAPKSAMFKQFEGIKSLGVTYDNIYWYSKSPETRYTGFVKPTSKKGGYWSTFYDMKPSGERPTMRYELFGMLPPKNYYWKWGKERALKAIENYKKYLEIAKVTGENIEEYSLRTGIKDFIKLDGNVVKYWVPVRYEDFLDNNWMDIPGYSSGWGFPTENSEQLLKRVIKSVSNPRDIVMDFFLGSGTTTAVTHKLGRKWIGIEMGEHFYMVILPRIKRVLAYDPSGISKDEDVKEHYNKDKAGGFFKYYELEQYEDTLRRVHYTEAEPFFDPTQDPYNQYIFMRDPKLSYILEADYENDRIKVNLEKLYNNIDLAETLSNLTGKWIRRITEDSVEFEDGERVDLKNPDYKRIKPLIWW